jgi:hypothetical protein
MLHRKKYSPPQKVQIPVMKAYRARKGKRSFPHHSTHSLSLSGQLQAAVLHLQWNVCLFVYSITLWHHGLSFLLLFSYGVRPSPLGSTATVWPVVPALDDRWWWWLWRPQIPHDLIRARTRAVAMGNRWLTAWAMAQPLWSSYSASSEDLHCLLVGWLSRICMRVCRMVVSYLKGVLVERLRHTTQSG